MTREEIAKDPGTWKVMGQLGEKFVVHYCPPAPSDPFPCEKREDGKLYCGWCKEPMTIEMQWVALLCNLH